MKKLMTLAALAALTVASTFALDLSAGIGAGYAYTNVDIDQDGASSSISDNVLTLNGMFDATYVQANLGFTRYMDGSVSSEKDSSNMGGNVSFLDLAILGKYPFHIGSVTIFPLTGIEYRVVLSASQDFSKNSNEIGVLFDNNQLWLKAGAGADFAINDKFYVRPEVIFGYKLDNSDENDIEDANDLTLTTIGVEASVYVGYKL